MKTEKNINVVKDYINSTIKSCETVIKNDTCGLYKNEDACQLAIKHIKKTKVKFKDISHEEVLEIFLEEALTKEHKMDYGTVEFDGKVLKITQQPFFDGTHDDQYYRASAEDEDGIEYQVIWDVKDEYLELEEDNNSFDESDMCDWTKFTVMKI